jgi:hypothetical protein
VIKTVPFQRGIKIRLYEEKGEGSARQLRHLQRDGVLCASKIVPFSKSPDLMVKAINGNKRANGCNMKNAARSTPSLRVRDGQSLLDFLYGIMAKKSSRMNASSYIVL